MSERGWQVDLTGYVQVDANLYSQASQDELAPDGTPLDETHFGIPRASLRADAHRGPLFGELELEGFTTRATLPRQTQTAGVKLETAWVGWHEQALVEVKAGLFRIPFGTLTPSSPRDRDFLELPTVSRALFPGDLDAGVMAGGAYGFARWSVAAMNGAPAGDTQWKGIDPASSYDFVARLGGDVPLPHKARITAGVSYIHGTGLSPGIPATKDMTTWVDENMNGLVEPSEIQTITGSPGIASQPFSRRALGGDLRASWCLCAVGTGYAFVEAVLATNLDRGLVYADPIMRSRDVRELGFAIGVVQMITDHAQVGVRFDRYDADRDAHETQGIAIVGNQQRFQTLSLMASGMWNGAKLIAQYDHARDPFGRDDTGAVVSRQNDRFTLRAQVGF